MLEVLTILDNTRSLHAWIQDLMPGGSQDISLLCTISRSQFTSHSVILSWFIITIQRETILYKIVLYFRE